MLLPQLLSTVKQLTTAEPGITFILSHQNDIIIIYTTQLKGVVCAGNIKLIFHILTFSSVTFGGCH